MQTDPANRNTSTRQDNPVWRVFLIFLRLGLTSFGGPVAHLGYFREEFVSKRKWLSESSYADLVALCQFLPGPASSLVGLGLGLSCRGIPGALAAWAGFTLPSAVALILFAMGISTWGDALPAGILQGLKLVAVAVVAQAVWGMARSLCPDALRLTLAILVAGVVLWLPGPWIQVAVLAAAGLAGLFLFPSMPSATHETLPIRIGKPVALGALGLFLSLLLGLPLLAAAMECPVMDRIDSFYRAGSLVFGGGHVVLPLLQSEVVPPGWISNETFMAGYGAAQAVPGPLFTFAAYLGASMTSAPSGWWGGLICLLAVFAPSILLVVGALPFWDTLRRLNHVRAALTGVNAAVVGLLLAALYHPVWTSAVHGAGDFVLALAAFAALMYWKLPPWLVVLACAAAGWVVRLLQ